MGNQKETLGRENVRDFLMSEKFGLDWQEYDRERMESLWYVMCALEERKAKENGKLK